MTWFYDPGLWPTEPWQWCCLAVSGVVLVALRYLTRNS